MGETNKIRVLVIDDSVFMRQMISDILAEDSEIEVVGQSSNGEDGIKKIKDLSPDIVTLDYQMPGLDGIAILKKIMRERPVPVVMISAYTKEGGEVALEALREGAIDYVLKPSGEISLDIETIKSEIIEKVKIAAKANLDATRNYVKFYAKPREKISVVSRKVSRDFAVSIGSSTGGVKGVELILESLPADFPAPILIVQHMPEMFTALFADSLNRATKIKVKEGEDGEEIKAGVAYIAPGGWHMRAAQKHKNTKTQKQVVIELTKDAPVHGLRPSADVLMKSVARVYGKDSMGIILSGMGSDGADGLGAISAMGGDTIAQDERTSVIFGMPKEAINAGVVDDVLPIDEIAGKMVEIINIKTLKH